MLASAFIWAGRWLLSCLAASGGALHPIPAMERDDPLTCVCCRERFACPMEWGKQDSGHWWIQLRCGACGHWHEVVVTNAQAARLDEALSRDEVAIAAAADGLRDSTADVG